MRPKIVVVGSVNMDLLVRCERIARPGETLLAQDAREAPGGKGANQAVGAARLGGDVRMIGRVGDDAFGGRLLANLQQEGVDTAATPLTEGCASGLAIVAVETSGENAITVIPGANGHVTPDDVAAARSMLHAANVVLMQLEVPHETVVAATQIAREGNVRTILDPAPALPETPAGLLDVDLICPNETEAEALLGRPVGPGDDALEAARALLALGPQVAVITLGSQGAVWATVGGDVGLVEAFPITPVDTTAAGDAFAAGVGLGLAEGAPLPDAVRLGCAAGAVAATRLGAQPAMPTRDEANRLINPSA